MLSVRYFKSDHPENLLHNSSLNMKKPGPSVWETCLQQLLTSSLTPSLQFKKCRDVLDFYLKTSSSKNEIKIILQFMKQAIDDCLKIDNLDLAEQEYAQLTKYVSHYSFQNYSNSSWANNTCHANARIVYISHLLSQMSSDSAWTFFDKINDSSCLLKDKDKITTGILNGLFSMNMNLSYTYIMFMNFLWQKVREVPDDVKSVLALSMIQPSAEQMEAKIVQFRDKLAQKKVSYSNFHLIYNLDRMLFVSFTARVRVAVINEELDLAEDFLKQSDLLQKRYDLDEKMRADCQVLRDRLELAKHVIKERETPKPIVHPVPINIVKEAPSPTSVIETCQSISSPIYKEQPKLTHKERERERRRLKKIEAFKLLTAARHQEIQQLVSETNRKPRCYTDNAALRELLDDISVIFNQSLCEGYLFGSANYKVSPNDFDIILPNIKSNREKAYVVELIKLFELQGAVVNADYVNKSQYRVIDISWKGRQIDFIVFEDSYPEHAKKLDFTVGAMYFDLKQKIMFRINSLSSFMDWDKKRITTIADAPTSFTSDPSRIFRAVRLVATEGFYFSHTCLDAIKMIFAGEVNLFKTMSKGKLNQQLRLLCYSGNNYRKNERNNIEVLHHQLGIFDKLYDILAARTDMSAKQFVSRLKPYRDEFLPDWNVSSAGPRSSLQQNSRLSLSPTIGFFQPVTVEKQQSLSQSRMSPT